MVTVAVPEGVESSVKARTINVKGPRGSLIKAFKHLSVDIYKVLIAYLKKL